MDIYQGEQATAMTRMPKLEKNNYHGWHVKFSAILGTKGCGRAILPSFEASLPTQCDFSTSDFVDESNPTADKKKKLKAVTQNNVAVSLLYSCISDDLAVEAQGSCGSTDWPLGKAYEVMKFVKSKHIETDAFTPVELKQAVNNISMLKFEDPETLKTQVAKVKTMYTSVVKIADDDNLVAQVLAAAPGFYSSVLITEQSIIESKGENLTPEKLIKAMRKQFRISNNKNKVQKDAKDKAALSNVHGGGDKYNNKKKKKWKRNNKKVRFQGHCDECGMIGHKKEDCWELEKNASKRPQGWKSRKRRDKTAAVSAELEQI